MAFLAYQRTPYDNQAERQQYFTLCKVLKEYYGEKNELCTFISNYNINGVELDGLIVKQDSIILVEFKNYGGEIQADENKYWTCKTSSEYINIQGGYNKNPFEQIRKNRANVANAIKNDYCVSDDQIKYIQAIIVFNQNIVLHNNLSSNTNKWLSVCDNNSFLETVRVSCSKGKGHGLSYKEILELISKMGLNEDDLDKDYCLIPPAKYETEKPYNGDTLAKESSSAKEDLLGKKKELEEKNLQLESKLQDLLAENDELKRKHTSELQEKDQLLDQINHKYEKSIREKEEAEQIAFDALSENERLKKLNDSDKPSILTSNTRTRNTENNENNAPRLTDPMLVKAWTLSNSELTTKEIIEKSRWRPINAYERLTKLVLKGYFDAKRYMDEDTYNLVMNSIKKFGTKADVHDIQNNCGRGISLWHVNMVLAELKYNKIVIKSPAEAKPSRIVETQIKDLVVDNVTQSLFENYIVNCFRIQYRKCFTRKPSNAILKEPEIVIELTAYGKVTTFAVATWFEQKVNTTFTLDWDYLSVYRKYSRKIDGEFYFVLGKGGTPQQPKKIYILPLSIFKKDTPVNLTSTYKAENVTGSFRYDINSGKLTLE